MKTDKKHLLNKLVVGTLMAGAALFTAHVSAEPVHIGSILSTTGSAAFLGEDMKAGMEMAIEDINASGGILGEPVKWTFYDSESQTSKAINSTRRLLTQDNVDAIVGGGNMSSIAIAMAPLAERAGKAFISTEGALDIIQPAEKKTHVFKSTVNDDQVINRLFDYFEKRGVKKIAVLADSTGFGQSATEQSKKISKDRDFEIIYETFSPGDTDMTAQLSKIKNAGVDAVLGWTVTPAGVVMLKQADQLGFDDIIMAHGYGFVDRRYMELAGDSVKDLVLVSVKFPIAQYLPDEDPIKDRVVGLQERFVERYGRMPNQYVAQAYDGIMLIKEAVERSGSKENIHQAIEEINDYAGMSGIFNFGPDRHYGLAVEDIVILNYKDGEFGLEDY